MLRALLLLVVVHLRAAASSTPYKIVCTDEANPQDRKSRIDGVAVKGCAALARGVSEREQGCHREQNGQHHACS